MHQSRQTIAAFRPAFDARGAFSALQATRGVRAFAVLVAAAIVFQTLVDVYRGEMLSE